MTARVVRTLELVIALIAAGGLGAPRARAAEGDAARIPPWLDEVTLDGFVSTSYSFNLNRPDSRTNQLRVFDFDDNSMKLDLFELVLQRAVSKPRESGFRVDVRSAARRRGSRRRAGSSAPTRVPRTSTSSRRS